MEKLVVKTPKTNDTEAQQRYARALDVLDKYLDLVELPPTDSEHYNQEFSTLVGESARLMWTGSERESIYFIERDLIQSYG